MTEPAQSSPELSGIVVQWGDPAPLRALVEAWPRDSRFELVVVDNQGVFGLARKLGAESCGNFPGNRLKPGSSA